MAGQAIRMKVSPGRAKPEFDDVARAAGRTGLPLHEVSSLAEEAWRQTTRSPGAGAFATPGDDDEPA